MKKFVLVILVIHLASAMLFAQFSCTKGDCENGHGACVFPNGARYEGDFSNGRIHGLGVLYFPNGDKYIGNWQNEYRHGKGRMKFASGNEYFGEFVRNQIQGTGTMTFVNGNSYKGEWVANQPNGHGILTTSSGNRYEGFFRDGAFNGQGTMYWSDGSRYEGEWKNNKRHGTGTYYLTDGSMQAGQWIDGDYQGTEETILVSTDPGIIPDDQTREGTEEHMPPVLRNCNLEYCAEGDGEYMYQNGTRYVGQFARGIPEGAGTTYYTNGDRYEGDWKDHAPHGRGTMYYTSGFVQHARWEFGRAIEVFQEEERGGTTPVENTAAVKIWAVVVGAAQYLHMPALRYTDDDAYQVYAFLKSPHGGAIPDEQIRLLVDEDARKSNISTAMRTLFAKADENDVILFYFSGHGIEGAFLPVDYDGFNNRLPHEEVRRVVEESPAKHKIVIADACHSGSIFLRRTPAHMLLEKYYTAFETTNGGMALMMSSKGEEYSLEDNGLRSGIFSHYLIKGLKGIADSDINGIVTVQEAFNYVHRNVRLYTGNVQTPLLMGAFDNRMPFSVIR